MNRATPFSELIVQFNIVTGEIVICDDFGGIDTDKDDKITVKEMQVRGTFHQNITTTPALVKQFTKKTSIFRYGLRHFPRSPHFTSAELGFPTTLYFGEFPPTATFTSQISLPPFQKRRKIATSLADIGGAKGRTPPSRSKISSFFMRF